MKILIYSLYAAILFLIALIQSNIMMIGHCLWPHRLKPAFISYDAQTDNHWELLLLAHMITLTPGTCTVDIDDSTLLIHAIHAPNHQAIITSIQHMHRPLKQVFSS